MNKLLDYLKKLFGSSKGFTLVELLVVIAILGVLLVGSIVAINPVRKINLAKDANAKAGIDQVASAEQSYYTLNQYYAAAVVDMVGTTSELKSEPKGPTGASFTAVKNPVACTTAGANCTDVAFYFTMLAPATAGNVWCWRSSVGKAAETTVAACTAP